MSKIILEDKLSEDRDRRLARVLGLSFNELSMTDFVIDTDVNNDGFVYGLIIKFSDSTPKYILNKIKVVDESNAVYLSSYALD